jgi:hypothetical protein
MLLGGVGYVAASRECSPARRYFCSRHASRFDDAYRFRMLAHLNTWMLGAFHARFVSMFSIMIENGDFFLVLDFLVLFDVVQGLFWSKSKSSVCFIKLCFHHAQILHISAGLQFFMIEITTGIRICFVCFVNSPLPRRQGVSNVATTWRGILIPWQCMIQLTDPCMHACMHASCMTQADASRAAEFLDVSDC